MRVSAIIPCYNYGKYLAQAIASVLAQTYPVAEILVVDDGSTDNTREVAASFGDRVRYIYQENQGPSAARNNGIREVTGDWIAFLDADDRWLPEKIELQVKAAEQDAKVALVYTAVSAILPDGRRVEVAAHDPRRLWPRLRYTNCVTGSCSATLIRRDVLVAEGGFDESIRGSEDWDLWVRLARKHRFAAVTAPVTHIQVWADGSSYNHERMMPNTLKILNKTLVCDLHGWRRAFWRRRIWSAELFKTAISARSQGPRQERAMLLESLREWPSPGFLPKRWVALLRNLMGAENWAYLARLVGSRHE
jgi:glycosyltransferase involved in cell wall biosynthesis